MTAPVISRAPMISKETFLSSEDCSKHGSLVNDTPLASAAELQGTETGATAMWELVRLRPVCCIVIDCLNVWKIIPK
jgi:hypothetical protein